MRKILTGSIKESEEEGEGETSSESSKIEFLAKVRDKSSALETDEIAVMQSR